MATLGGLLFERREELGISQNKAARDLVVKEEVIDSLENGQYLDLPEPTFVKGLIRSYAQYLGLDSDHLLALYRREYDETKYPKKSLVIENKKLKITPTSLTTAAFVVAIVAFIVYVIVQYFSVLTAPKLAVTSPQNDETTTIPIVQINGQTEKETSISIDGQLVPVDDQGNFSYKYNLKDGQNIIEIIASKKLSPKSKVTKIVRLTR